MTERAEKLRALAERVEAAPAGKPYDYMGTEAGAAMLKTEHDLTLILYPFWEGLAGFGSHPLHSLDACAALHEAALGERWVIESMMVWPKSRVGALCRLWEVDATGTHNGKMHGRVESQALTEPRARFAAILRALAEEDG